MGNKKDQERRRKARLAKRRTHKAQKSASDLISNLDPLPLDEYHFWLCHGANYLNSDWDEGLWEPLYPSIYGGVVPDQHTAIHQAMSGYDMTDPDIPPSIAVAVAWLFTSAKQMRVFRDTARNAALVEWPNKDPDQEIRRPHNPVVWAMMQEVKVKAQRSTT